MPRIWFSFLRTYRMEWKCNFGFCSQEWFRDTRIRAYALTTCCSRVLLQRVTYTSTRVHAMSSFSENDTSRTRACVYVAPGLSADRRVSYIHIYIHVCILTDIDIKKKKKCSKKDISRQQGTSERTRLPALSRVSIYYSCTSYTRYKG